MDAIHADLNGQLDDTTAEGGTDTNPEAFTDTSQLESPQFDPYNKYTLSTPKSPSSESSDPLGMLSFTAFATSCATKPATKTLGHYLDQIAFATVVMNGVALVASGQQLCSADGILLKPSSLSEAQKRGNWMKRKEAMNVKMDSMQKMDVFELVDLPMDGKLIGVQWVYKLKLDAQRCATQYKARLIAQGYTQRPGLDYDQTFSPVICLQTVHILLALAHRYRLHIVKSVRQQLSSVFSIMDQGNVTHIIRMNVKYDCEVQMLLIDQSGYIEGTLEKFGMSDAWAVHSPARGNQCNRSTAGQYSKCQGDKTLCITGRLTTLDHTGNSS
ncbi:hypothetical protein NDA13_002986 [Ustilago tritici]|nr:hypothetical protein NDA13_002986 [Ustilago tritici]